MRFLLLIVAAIIAVIAGVSALQLSSRNTGPVPVAGNSAAPVNTVDVLVARDAIPAGTLITAAMYDKQPWPESLLLKGFIINGSPEANVIGKVARASFQAREPLTVGKLSNVTDVGFLAAMLPPDMRAVTIATDTVTGVAGFIFPGDRVDVLFTHDIPGGFKGTENKNAMAPSSDKPAFTEVLLTDVPVLAINLRDGWNREGAPPPAESPNSTAAAPTSVTLQVKDVQAEKLRLAEKVGTLSLALRSISDKDKPATGKPMDLSGLTQVRSSSVAPQVEDDTVKVTKR